MNEHDLRERFVGYHFDQIWDLRNDGHDEKSILTLLRHKYPYVNRGITRLILSLLPEGTRSTTKDLIPRRGRYVPSSIRQPSQPGTYWVVTDTYPSTGSPIRGTFDPRTGWKTSDDSPVRNLFWHENESY